MFDPVLGVALIYQRSQEPVQRVNSRGERVRNAAEMFAGDLEMNEMELGESDLQNFDPDHDAANLCAFGIDGIEIILFLVIS